jgi:predicted nucleotidyltransferase
MKYHCIEVDREKIAGFCRRHRICRLSFFGSILRQDFRPESDVDALVEFLPGAAPGWFGFARLALELEVILGREVDLRTPADLSDSIRARALAQSEVQYAA